MKILDAHHHIWIPEQSSPDLGYGWLRDIGAIKPFGDPTAIQRDYTWAEYVEEPKRHNIDASVYVQVDGAIADPVAETRWVQSVIDRPANRFRIVGLVDLTGSHAQAHIEAQVAFESFKGVRQIISFLDDRPQLSFAAEHLLRNSKWTDQFALIADHGLSFDLQLYPEQMAEAAEFFSQFPNVPIVIDHAGSPYDQTKDGMLRWQEGLAVISQLNNVSIKLSGFGMFDKHWDSTSIQPMIDVLLTLFGPERMMFGSNFPVDKLMADFDDTVDRVLKCIEYGGDAAVVSVFGQTACRFYRFDE